MKLGPRFKRWIPYLILSGQNILIFSRHYQGKSFFPWDFPMTYHAVPFYWITSLQLGRFPEWIPFQAMGYPLQMNLQSGLFYLPLWVFVLVGSTYSLNTAVVMQCLHVLVGAIGMYALARLYGLGRRYALFGAASYQFFGGFYSNAEHVDIIRGFAWLPWLMYGLHVPRIMALREVRRGLVAVSAATYLLWTGAYPGMTVAVLLVASAHTSVELMRTPRTWQDRGQWILVCLAGLLCGTGISLVHILPAWLLRHEFVRYASYSTQGIGFLGWDHLFTVVFPYDSPRLARVDISMRSVFVTMPVVGLLVLLQPATLKRLWPWLITAVFSVLMMTGTVIYRSLVTLLPPLGFSRFPAADYRGFVGIALILLAAAALSDLVRDPERLRRTIVWRITGLTSFLAFGAYRLGWWSAVSAGMDLFAMTAVSVVLVLLFFIYSKSPRALLVAAMGGVLFVNGMTYHLGIRVPWYAPGVDVWHAQTCGYQSPLSEGQLKTALTQGQQSRPERKVAPKPRFCAWGGYLFGTYRADDKSGGIQLKRVAIARQHPVLSALMVMESRVLLQPTTEFVTDRELKALLTSPGSVNSDSVRLLEYAPSGLTYEVSLTAPRLMIENEMYFPGWRAILEKPSGDRARLQAEEVAGALRGWRLPPGQYVMRTEFRMPYLRQVAVVSLAVLGLWVMAVAWVSIAIQRQVVRLG